MDYRTARQFVIADQREAADSDSFTDVELLANVPRILTLEDVEGDDDLATAYRLVLFAPRPVAARSNISPAGRLQVVVAVPGRPDVRCMRSPLTGEWMVFIDGSSLVQRTMSWRDALDKAVAAAREIARLVDGYSATLVR